MSYQSVSLLDTKSNVLWTLSCPISHDTIAGLLVGLQHIINETLLLEIIDSTGNISTINVAADHIPFINDYLTYRSVPYNMVTRYYSPLGYYSWWIFDRLDNTYSLYSFTTNDFIQGFILAFDIFTIINPQGGFTMGFRDFIGGPPFHTEITSHGTKINIFYNIEGYDIRPLVYYRRDPAPTGPFHINSYRQYITTGPDPKYITDQIYSEYPIDYQ